MAIRSCGCRHPGLWLVGGTLGRWLGCGHIVLWLTLSLFLAKALSQPYLAASVAQKPAETKEHCSQNVPLPTADRVLKLAKVFLKFYRREADNHFCTSDP